MPVLLLMLHKSGNKKNLLNFANRFFEEQLYGYGSMITFIAFSFPAFPNTS